VEMLRTARVIQAERVHHVLNRGNGRMRLFHTDAHAAAFERVRAERLRRYDVDFLTYCRMGDHEHLTRWLRPNDATRRLIGRVGVTYATTVRATPRAAATSIRGRFRSIPVQEESHSLSFCGHVEANTARAKLIRRAEDWPWGGVLARGGRRRLFALADWPEGRPRGSAARVSDARAGRNGKVTSLIFVQLGRACHVSAWACSLLCEARQVHGSGARMRDSSPLQCIVRSPLSFGCKAPIARGWCGVRVVCASVPGSARNCRAEV